MATAHDPKPIHTCAVFDPPGQHEGDEHRYDVECDVCGWVGAADTQAEANVLVRLHEKLIAQLIDRMAVPS